jgi:hypothetical protein
MLLETRFPIPVDGTKSAPASLQIWRLLAPQQSSRTLQGHQARTAHIGGLAEIEEDILPSPTHYLLGRCDQFLIVGGIKLTLRA